jgi:hypothetical protein
MHGDCEKLGDNNNQVGSGPQMTRFLEKVECFYIPPSLRCYSNPTSSCAPHPVQRLRWPRCFQDPQSWNIKKTDPFLLSPSRLGGLRALVLCPGTYLKKKFFSNRNEGSTSEKDGALILNARLA